MEEEAKSELESCCQTLCASSIVSEYIKTLEEENKELKARITELENNND